ncbi:hypothetical protein N9B94_03705, partial [Verrucomicrobia bacterium]|nr:hypothetical protein [Verrucomicrobiota bacterium]
MKSRRSRVRVGSVIFLISVVTVIACGRYLPVVLMKHGSRAFLTAPMATFLKAMHLVDTSSAVPKAVPSKSGVFEQTRNMALVDLEAALKHSSLTPEERTEIVLSHTIERKSLQQFAYKKSLARKRGKSFDVEPQAIPQFNSVGGLPLEFALYFEGAIDYHKGNLEEASAKWLELLAMEADERYYRTVWAAFMLGKVAMVENPNDVAFHFGEARKRAKEGFEDSLGLASASLGLEAKFFYESGNYERALELYHDQLAGGDNEALASIKVVVGNLLRMKGTAVSPVARNPRTRLIVANLLMSSELPTHLDTSKAIVSKWLSVLEEEDIQDSRLAEVMATAAYRHGRFKMAQRWIFRAEPESVVTQWLQAKLHLRDGKEEEAAAIYSLLIPMLSAIEEDSLASALSVYRSHYDGNISIDYQIRG